jgi:hypothetical protein
MIHGWPPTLAAVTACVCVGRLYATTLSEGVSRFIPIYALLYSLLETAQLVGVEPKAYLSEATRRVIQQPDVVFLPHDLLT